MTATATPPKPSAHSRPPELPPTDEITTKLTTDQIVPVKAIARGCQLIDSGTIATTIKIEGQDTRLLSGLEKQAYVRRMSDLFNTMTGGFSIYATSRPRNTRYHAENLDRKRAIETNPNLRQQYWVEKDFLDALGRDNLLTQRNYYLTVQASQNDLRAGQGKRQEEEDKPQGFIKTFKNNFLRAFGRDPNEATASTTTGSKNAKKTKAESLINPVVAESLRFRAESFATQTRLGSRCMTDQEIGDTLAEIMGSPLAHRPGLDPLHKIGGVDFAEYPGYLKIGEYYVASLFITDYPKTIRLNALFQLMKIRDIQMFVALHATPLDSAKAEAKLRNQQSLLNAVAANDKSSTGNMQMQNKIESIGIMRSLLARNEARLFKVGLRVSVRAKTKGRLFNDLRRVSQLLTEMGYANATASRNQRRAFFSAIPFGEDFLGKEKLLADRTLHPNLTGENLACLMPNCIVDFTQKKGILQGTSKADGSMITFDRRDKDSVNPHSIFCATSGSGKSFAQMCEMIRELLDNPKLECFYIDPQGVFGPFAEMVGGTVIDMGVAGNAVINPMDRYVLNGKPERMGERLAFMRPLLELMLGGEMTATEKSSFTRALKRMYAHFEQGENMLHILEMSFRAQAIYAPIRDYISDWSTKEADKELWYEGVMSKLARIYAEMRAKYNIPTSGLVKGVTGADGVYRRPICELIGDRWYYSGKGETNESLPMEEYEPGKRIPAAVWYPDRKWLKGLMHDFQLRVQEEKVFEGLDSTAAANAIRDAFVALKLGMPILEDIMPFLAAELMTDMVSNLEPYIDPQVYGGMFNGYTNVALDKRFICFNVRDLDDELLKSIRMFQVINYTWGMVRGRRVHGKVPIPVNFVADELGVLLKTFAAGSIGDYISSLFMRGRYFGLAMTVIVQNISSLLDHSSIRECVENANRVVLMKQDQTATPRLRKEFNLTDGQLAALVDADKGEAFQRINNKWIHLRYAIPKFYLDKWNTQPSSEDAA